MSREVKVKVTLETEEKLTEDEVNALKKALSGQLIKTLSSDGIESRIFGIIENICHVEPVHTPHTLA